VRHSAAQQGRRAEGVAHPRLERGQRRVERGGGERRGGRGAWVEGDEEDEKEEAGEDRWWRWSRHGCLLRAALVEAPGSGESGGGWARDGGGGLSLSLSLSLSLWAPVP